MPLYPTYILLLLLLYREVSWCSWLSHHFHVVRVPGSNPGGTILLFFLFPIYYFLLKKQRREVSINRPASYEPAALPLRHPALLTIFFYFSFSLFPVNFREKIPSPGIEPGAQTWKACMLPTTPRWTLNSKRKRKRIREAGRKQNKKRIRPTGFEPVT